MNQKEKTQSRVFVPLRHFTENSFLNMLHFQLVFLGFSVQVVCFRQDFRLVGLRPGYGLAGLSRLYALV